MTGSGCSLTGILGAFLAVTKNEEDLTECANAVVAAITCVNVAAEVATKSAAGPGTFQAGWFDALYQIDDQTMNTLASIFVLKEGF